MYSNTRYSVKGDGLKSKTSGANFAVLPVRYMNLKKKFQNEKLASFKSEAGKFKFKLAVPMKPGNILNASKHGSISG